MNDSYFSQRERVWLVLVGLTITGCGGAAPTSNQPAKRMVYVDTATMQPLVHDVATTIPAIHPKTGQATLRPALYCPTCRKWIPVPALEEINRTPGAGLCPEHKTPLTADGPWPDDPAANPASKK